MQLLGNLDIPKKQNSSGDVQPEYMDFYNSLRMVNDQGPQTIAKLVYTEANEGLLQISQTTRRNFYRPHNQHKFMVSPQRNVNFDAKKGVSELEGLTFPSTSLSAFFSSRGPKSNQDSCLMYAVCVEVAEEQAVAQHHVCLEVAEEQAVAQHHVCVEVAEERAEAQHHVLVEVPMNVNIPPHPIVASRMCGSCRRTGSGVASRLCGSCRRTGSGVASRTCGSANER